MEEEPVEGTVWNFPSTPVLTDGQQSGPDAAYTNVNTGTAQWRRVGSLELPSESHARTTSVSHMFSMRKT